MIWSSVFFWFVWVDVVADAADTSCVTFTVLNLVTNGLTLQQGFTLLIEEVETRPKQKCKQQPEKSGIIINQCINVLVCLSETQVLKKVWNTKTSG